jgi:hypothetical protein
VDKPEREGLCRKALLCFLGFYERVKDQMMDLKPQKLALCSTFKIFYTFRIKVSNFN